LSYIIKSPYWSLYYYPYTTFYKAYFIKLTMLF